MSKYDGLLNHDDDMLQFTREFLEEHHYLSAKMLSREYNKCSNRYDKPSRSSLAKFGQILGNLTNIGVLEKYNSFQYKKKTEYKVKKIERA